MDELITSSGIRIELAEKVPIPLNLSIADFKEPEKRQRNFSKEIDIPGTAGNMRYFASAFSLTKIGGVYDFNSSAKVNCTYYKSSRPVLRNAILKLNKVIILDDNVTFKVGLFSDFVDTFLLLSTINIGELDWSEYNHTLTNANIQASWTAPIGVGYHYPLIERRQRTGLTKWVNTEMVPYVHLVEVFKKCMDFVGQKYSSTFLSTTRPKSILFGYGGGSYVDNAVSPTEQNLRKVLLTGGVITYTEKYYLQAQFDGYGNTIYLIGETAQFHARSFCTPYVPTGVPILSITETQDLYNQNVVNTFTAQRTGGCKVTLTGSIRFNYTGDFDYVSGGGTILYYEKNGVSTAWVTLNQTAVDQTFVLDLSVNLELNQGDIITFSLGSSALVFVNGVADPGGTGTGDNYIRRVVSAPTPLAISYFSTASSLIEGSIVELGRMLPSMKGSEFVLGFLRLFKLMVSDPDIYGVVRIEPEVQFYQGTNVFTDITEEVEHKREIEIRPSANEYAKTLSYSYKMGTETDAKKYMDKWGIPYGNLSFDQPSFFAKGEQKMELPFGNIIPYEIYSGVLVPRFVDVDNAGAKKPTAGVARIMYRNGLKAGAWQLVGSTTLNLSSYPCVHHFDNYQNPTFDLNWKLVEEVLYATNVVTTINTYSEYYSQFIWEIISSEGKYVQLYRKMNDLQIRQLDWSRLLMWNGSLFRFNRVVDFDSSITEVTKIEMIKVLEARSVNRRQITTAKKLSPLYTKTKIGAPGVGTGAPILSGGNGMQVLELSNIFKG